jgi:hypothetical protein
MPNGEPGSFYVDSFSTAPVEPARLSELFRQDVTLVPQLIKAWEENHCEPVVFDAAAGSAAAGSALGRELERIGAGSIVAHGTYDASGELASFFTFGCAPGMAGSQQRRVAGLVVPFLHAAWMRIRINWPAEGAGVKPAAESVLSGHQRTDGEEPRAEDPAQVECAQPHAGDRQGARTADPESLSGGSI